MKRRAVLPALVLLALAPVLAAAQQTSTATGAAKPHRLVIQVSDADPGKWNLALNNAKNVQEDLGAANVAIEIVAYGPGLGMLRLDATSNSRVSEAVKAGIKVVACENTMRAQHLTVADMHPDVSYTPAGVTEIMRLQQSGWSYVRP